MAMTRTMVENKVRGSGFKDACNLSMSGSTLTLLCRLVLYGHSLKVFSCYKGWLPISWSRMHPHSKWTTGVAGSHLLYSGKVSLVQNLQSCHPGLQKNFCGSQFCMSAQARPHQLCYICWRIHATWTIHESHEILHHAKISRYTVCSNLSTEAHSSGCSALQASCRLSSSYLSQYFFV